MHKYIKCFWQEINVFNIQSEMYLLASIFKWGSIFAGVSSFFPPFTNVNEPPEAAQMCPQRKSKDFYLQEIIGRKCFNVSSFAWPIITLTDAEVMILHLSGTNWNFSNKHFPVARNSAW